MTFDELLETGRREGELTIRSWAGAATFGGVVAGLYLPDAATGG